MLAIVGEYHNIDIKNFICSELIYCPNSNNLAKTFIFSHNSTNMLKKFVSTNDLIYFKKPLIIYFISILIHYLKSTCAVRVFFSSFC